MGHPTDLWQTLVAGLSSVAGFSRRLRSPTVALPQPPKPSLLVSVAVQSLWSPPLWVAGADRHRLAVGGLGTVTHQAPSQQLIYFSTP